MTFKEFSWERYQAGEAVQFRCGKLPDEIIRFKREDCDYPIATQHNGKTIIHTLQGCFYRSGFAHNYDLVMKPKKKTVWVNLYNNAGNIVTCGYTFKSQQEARKDYCGQVPLIGTFPIEIEE